MKISESINEKQSVAWETLETETLFPLRMNEKTNV